MKKQKTGSRVLIWSGAAAFFFAGMAVARNVFGQWNKSNYDSTGLPKSPIVTIIGTFLFWLLSIFGFVAVIGFVISGIIYFASAGDEDTQERAKRAMIYSITGVVVGLVGVVVLLAVYRLLSSQVF